MRRGRLMAGGIGIAACGFLAGALVAGDHEGMDEAAMMQAWAEYATPGDEHAEMMKSVGTWNVASTFWEYPGAEAQKSDMKSQVKSVLGGRFLAEKFTGTVSMGEHSMPFEGRGLFGYDNLQKKHISVWTDNMMTGVMLSTGEADASGRTVTYRCDSAPNPMTGGFDKIKSVARMLTDDKHTFEMHRMMPDGTWHKNMKLVYTRAK